MNFELWVLNSSLKLVAGWQSALLAVPALLILAGVINGFCWFFANSLAANAEQPDIAAVAALLSPADPLVHSQVAAFKTRSFNPADLPEATSQFEQAVALSPNDYRYWYALARTRERTGDATGAERAATRAVELAPNYAQALWLSGNVLLRRGEQQPEAIARMRRAAEADPQFAIHFVAAAAQTVRIDDLNNLQAVVGNNIGVRAALVSFLTQAKKFEAAVRVWRELPDKEKRESGKDLSKALLDAKMYRATLPFYQLAAANETEKPSLNRFLNGGFENDIAAADSNPFVWQIAAGAQPQIALFESAKHGGARSLIVFFNSPTGADFRTVSQTVVVESNAEYHFEAWVKTEKLQSGNPIFWEIVETGDNRVLTKTTNVPTGDNDWQKLSADFRTSGATEAVTFRLGRSVCAQPPVCSINGKILFDDFTLQKN